MSCFANDYDMSEFKLSLSSPECQTALKPSVLGLFNFLCMFVVVATCVHVGKPNHSNLKHGHVDIE